MRRIASVHYSQRASFRFFPLAFGTQTAGSIIRPAAFCGVVGYKPSFGTIARSGMKLMSESLDTIGAMARSPIAQSKTS